MKKLFIAMLLCSAMVLTACGAKKEEPAAVETEEVDTEEEIIEEKDESSAEDAEAEESEGMAEAEAIKELSEVDLSGTYVTADGECEFTAEKNEDNTYNVSFSVFRLCSMEGTANVVDGALEIMFTDPSEADMSAVFFEDEDAYTLHITESTWTYISTGDEFVGFTAQ